LCNLLLISQAGGVKLALRESQPTDNHKSRRSFLGKLSVAAAALAGASTGLIRLGKNDPTQPQGEFPGKGSIFHPAQDPRNDPRRS